MKLFGDFQNVHRKLRPESYFVPSLFVSGSFETCKYHGTRRLGFQVQACNKQLFWPEFVDPVWSSFRLTTQSKNQDSFANCVHIPVRYLMMQKKCHLVFQLHSQDEV